MLRLSEINIYPIKSLGGISLQTSEVEERGLKNDRRWVLVDESNTFFTQRDFTEMALINVALEKDGLKLSHKTKDYGSLFVPFEFEHTKKDKVVIWDDTVVGEFYNSQIDDWLTCIKDVSEAVRAVARLKESEEKYRALVGSTGDSIYLVDRQCRYLFMNRRHMARMGFSGDEFLGRSYADYHGPRRRSGSRTRWSGCSRRGSRSTTSTAAAGTATTSS